MKYYAMDRTGENPHRWIDSWPSVKGMWFGVGEKIPETVAVPDPLILPLKPLNKDAWDHGPEMPEYFKGRIPLFRDDFIEALKEFGVNNIDYYNAVITDPDENDKEHTNYKAANVIGFSDDLGEIVKQNLPIARHDMYIIIREDLKEHLLKKGYDKLKFDDLGDVAMGVAD